MRIGGKIIILVIIMALLMTPFCSVILAEDISANPDQTLKATILTRINPIYAETVDNFHVPSETMQPMAEPVYTPVADMPELRAALRAGFDNWDTTIALLYTGIVSSNEEMQSLVNAASSEIASVIEADDYLKFSYQSYSPSFTPISGGNVNIIINIVYLNDVERDASNLLTTRQQEDYVNNQVAQILTSNIEPGMNDHQKVKAIHDYIVSHVVYDNSFSKHTAYPALTGAEGNTTVCQGYALLAYKMLTESGFQARIIDGKAGTGSDPALWGRHAWNRVLLDGKWYNLDCTWDDPMPDVTGRVLYPYYHLNDVELNVNHTADPEYTGLQVAAESYTTTMENLIATNPANEIYPRLQQQLGFNYFLAVNTAENASELEAKWLAAAQDEISNFKLRYKSSIEELNNNLGGIFDSIAGQTTLNACNPHASIFNRGAGTGYLLLDFDLSYSIPNAAPTTSSVAINGYANVDQTLTGTYTYTDTEGNEQGLSHYQWYRATNLDGSDKTLIPGAIGTHYTVNTRDEGKYLFFEVLPIASAGTLQGVSVLSLASAAVGPVLEKVAQPTSNVPAGAVASGTTVTLSTVTTNASIYYTLDGTTPTPESGTLYATEITIDAARTIKAIAVKDGALPSDVAEFAYTIAATDECFIATAAFGSKFTWPVALLRHFRDQYLLTNPAGRAFVDFYYRNSPPIAVFISGSESLKALVRVLLAPIIAAVYMIYHPALSLIFLILVAITGYIFIIRRKNKITQASGV